MSDATAMRQVPFVTDDDPMNTVPGTFQAMAERAEALLLEWSYELT